MKTILVVICLFLRVQEDLVVARSNEFRRAFLGREIEKLVKNVEIVTAIELEEEVRGALKRQIVTGTEWILSPRFSLLFTAFNKEFNIGLSANERVLGREATEKNSSNSRTHYGLAQDCYYQGKVRSSKKSNVAVSICGGVYGIIEYDSDSFFIEPFQTENKKIKHIIYSLKERKEILGKKCFKSKKKHWRKSFSLKKQGSFQTRDIAYVQTYLLIDTSVVKKFNGDTKRVKEYSKQVINIVDSWLGQLNVRVVIRGIEIWGNQDKIRVDANSTNVLKKVLEYKTDHVDTKYRINNLQFITRKSLDDESIAGIGTYSSICDPYSVGINRDILDHPLLLAMVMVHQIGHNLGLKHDNHQCKCTNKGNRCIMGKKFNMGVGEFSDCSREDWNRMWTKGYFKCLSHDSHGNHGNVECGNGIQEDGEDCDCGGVSQCEKANPCCDHKTCKLFANTTCSTGACCVNCRVASKTTVCRTRSNECDIPEYCDGKSDQCPADVGAADEKACDNARGYCYQTRCHSHDMQCRNLYGENAQMADLSCYDKNNQLGTPSGNCGELKDGYKKCPKEDILCGTLQCRINIHEKHRNKTTLKTDTIKCLSLQLWGQGPSIMTDKGTRCGDGKRCINQKCLPLNLKSPCPLDCSEHGTCNWRSNQCDCQHGWKPPFCDVITRAEVIDNGAFNQTQEAKVMKSVFSPSSSLFKPSMIIGGCLFLIVLIAFGLFIKYKLETGRKNALLAKRILVQYHSASSDLGNVNSLISNKKLFNDVTTAG